MVLESTAQRTDILGDSSEKNNLPILIIGGSRTNSKGTENSEKSVLSKTTML